MGEINKTRRVQRVKESLLNIGTLTKEHKKDKRKTETNSNRELFQSELERFRDEASN